MEILVSFLPWLIAMGVLIGCSAFFSASEAALFFLRNRDRRSFITGTTAQRTAAHLLADPERLLSAVLFWNLVVNIAYFAIASMVSMWIQKLPGQNTLAFAFTCGALLTIIFFSEMLPKSLALLSPQKISQLVALPMAVAVRITDPLMPAVKLVNLLSRRLLYPKFKPEPYLEVADLERAIQLSTSDAELAEREEATLQSVVQLSEIRADELMRPRMQFRSFRPPVALDDLAGELPRSISAPSREPRRCPLYRPPSPKRARTTVRSAICGLRDRGIGKIEQTCPDTTLFVRYFIVKGYGALRVSKTSLGHCLKQTGNGFL